MLPLGNLIISDKIHEATKDGYLTINELKQALDRHINLDWGDGLSDMDKAANDYALKIHARILSSYIIRGTMVWIISEHNGPTNVLLP